MSISFLGALAGTLAALAGAGLLVRLCARAFRMDLVAFVVALAGLALALAAQALGYHRGFGPTTFRAAQLGAALIAPLALCWGMVELTAKGLAGRFAARLCLGGLFVVAAVILATDVLSSQPFSLAWPAARLHFEFLPLGLLALVAVVVFGTTAGTLATMGVRARRDPRWRAALPAAAPAAAGALATQGLLVHLPVNSADVVLCLVAGAGAWLAGDRAARVPLAALRHGRDAATPPGRAAGPGWAANGAGGPGYAGEGSLDLYHDGYRGYDDSGGYVATGGYGDTGSLAAPGGYGDTGSLAAPGGHGAGGGQGAAGGYPAQPGGGYDGYPATGGFASYPAAGYPAELGYPGPAGTPAGLPPEPVTGAFDALYRDSGPGPQGREGAAAAARTGAADAGIEFATGMQLAALEEAVLAEAARDRVAGGAPGRPGAPGPPDSPGRPDSPAAPDSPGRPGGAGGPDAAAGRGGAGDRDLDVDTDRLYGQIAIYTLLEAGAAEFDRLSGEVLAKVRTGEPHTLVYVVHQVPSAPLQRILYQVYRDRNAYDEHQRQPYVTDFDTRLRPLVLATNVIELGVSELKVAALRARSAGRGQPR